jgi:hypothetical protein
VSPHGTGMVYYINVLYVRTYTDVVGTGSMRIGMNPVASKHTGASPATAWRGCCHSRSS